MNEIINVHDGELGFTVAHIGVNAPSEAEALKAARLFEDLFGFKLREIPISYFAGDGIEIMKGLGRGTLGHIAIGTRDVPKAVAFLEGKGVEFDRLSVQNDENGAMRFIYLKDEVLGFAIHLTKRV
jgi:2-dehydro-3-deoxyphosphogluconate aldolase/(4S)-4-hydroxy-2-oxoglutarate aldolase